MIHRVVRLVDGSGMLKPLLPALLTRSHRPNFTLALTGSQPLRQLSNRAPYRPLAIVLRYVSSTTRGAPTLQEDDLEETYVRGSGPGGQSINKTSISVSLIHRPTGIRVQCHETRSREQNRKLARRRLAERVDLFLNPGTSKVEMKWEKERKKKQAKSRKARRKRSVEDEKGETSQGIEDEAGIGKDA